MLIKATCQHCRHEFDADAEERTVFCPACRRETFVLSRPQNFDPLLTKFPSCESEVSTKAASCPKCGHQFRYAGGINLKDPIHVIGLIVCVVIIILVALYIIGISLVYKN
jgi:DNA-directed RNA polymerase subunit RPC12/RpoP